MELVGATVVTLGVFSWTITDVDYSRPLNTFLNLATLAFLYHVGKKGEAGRQTLERGIQDVKADVSYAASAAASAAETAAEAARITRDIGGVLRTTKDPRDAEG